ncbi:FMN-dependent dehydrogenase, includes L-lactate dehydrogenase and type II isopentenyl diphosphate isomerase [Hathewaya proteolytica DSM 3090]|uniref:L-lactate oxidase n=1 Tax=Hathewaya proteolytica DSM 3090 TaxID=1121331 RepID=A0A1M6QT21_9CLOT|nr:alpha-hydroxy-acid oxidizing protein [Hathewaya proteolytica]SHK23263.1 FMN-dependent dehydrogenase, includes L-lactate dehydrogenase and type II isopentenyl diphosphate isomerase [Hathewaya proteolytica DSM 3090]
MSFQELMGEARKNLNNSCRVCKVCNGVACAGEVPGMGGLGTATSFKNNVESLSKIKLNMKTIHNAKNPDMETELFGKKMSVPVFAAPVSGTTLNMGGKLTEREYISMVIDGCLESGIYPMVGDTAVDTFLPTNLEELKKRDGNGIAFIKPWKNNVVIEKIKKAEDAGVFAVGMDIDACGLITLALHGKPVMPKEFDEIKEIIDCTKLPFIVKGVMCAEEAKMAVELGAKAIVVSNHGGRVLDFMPGVAEVLSEVSKAVKGKITILADGGIRSGVDVLKFLALGADGVLIGRPFVWASFGGGAQGVREYVEKIKGELKSAMILTGCQDIASINESIIYRE